MGEAVLNEDEVFKQVVRYDGPADYKDMYELLWKWLDGKGFKIYEKRYTIAKSGSGAQDISIAWEATKQVNDYIKLKIDVSILLLNLKDVEVLQNGAKTTVTTGTFKNTFVGTLITGNDTWNTNDFLRLLRRFYDHYFFGRPVKVWSGKPPVGNIFPLAFGQYAAHLGKLDSICNALVNENKAFFGIYQM